jgi:hypothetical protein
MIGVARGETKRKSQITRGIRSLLSLSLSLPLFALSAISPFNL